MSIHETPKTIFDLLGRPAAVYLPTSSALEFFDRDLGDVSVSLRDLSKEQATPQEIRKDIYDLLENFYSATLLKQGPNTNNYHQKLDNLARELPHHLSVAEEQLSSLGAKLTYSAGIDDLQLWNDGDSLYIVENPALFDKDVDIQSVLFLIEMRFIVSRGCRGRCFQLTDAQNQVLDQIEHSVSAPLGRYFINSMLDEAVNDQDAQYAAVIDRYIGRISEFRMPLSQFLDTVAQTPEGLEYFLKQKIVKDPSSKPAPC